MVITRRDKPLSELMPRKSLRDLLPLLHALREALPQQASSVDTVRALRDEVDG